MCGIAGGVGAIDGEVTDAIARCSDFQAHRGPDAKGTWRSDSEPEFGAYFAHRRLAIIDLSDAGRQPMHDPSTGNVLCFNGEIYNFGIVRGELESLGHEFRTQTDSEVILKSYAQWGRDCVRHFRGMFAFALWDATSRRVLIARDRVGIKPLYISEVQRPAGKRIAIFASEVRALLESGLVDRRLSETALSTYLWNGFVNGSATIVDGIRSFPAGHTGWIDADGTMQEPERFWSLPTSSTGSGSDEDREEHLADKLQQAVRDRLIADVPLGVFLSGGIDSSAMANLASRCSQGIRTFNIAFDESEFDESSYARAVAEHIGTEHHEIHLGEARFASQLESALGGLDQPTFDGINTYFVSRAVREAGITVAVSGAGGDELFGGYRSFRDIPKAATWARRLGVLPDPVRRRLAGLVTRLKTGPAGVVPPQTRWGKLADALATKGDIAELYQVSYGLFSSAFLAQLSRLRSAPTSHGLAAADSTARDRFWRDAPTLHGISNLELMNFIGERLLRDTDTASMAVALEVRVPLLDHEVIEAAAGMSIPRRYEPLGRKDALRRNGLRGLPTELFDRPKSGFVLPLEVWSRNALKGDIDATLRDRGLCEASGLNPDAVLRLWEAHQAGAPGIYWSRIWAIFVLLHWTRRYRVTL